MASIPAAALRKAIRSVAKGDQPEATDRELLRRFAREEDQGAFTTLVARHTGMVLGVCRRVLPTVQDAEDACQATFVVLARKAGDGRWQASVVNWLYTTARRVARNARVVAQRRARREARAAVPEVVEPVDQMTGRELLAAMDEELDKLPPHYREPLVLCYLEGLTRDEAAARLGIPIGTLRTRLERGRKRLHDALTKGGCALGAGLLALAVTSPAGASPPRLVNAILAAVSGPVPDAVAELAKGVTVNGIAKQVGLILVAAVGVVALGIGLGSQTSPAVGQPPDKPAPAAKDKPADSAGLKEIIVTGKVLDGEGKPIAGAQVASGAAKVTTGADGQFRFPVAKADPYERVMVTATAKGHGPDWAVLDDKAGEVTLRLPADDVPFTGRIATLENQPLKDVTVEVVRLGKPTVGDLTAWVDKNVKMRKEHYWLNENGMTIVPGGLALENAKATTDADGKFTLTGCGRDRILTVKVYGPNVETKFFWVVNRSGGPKDGYIKTSDFNHGLYPPDVTVLLAPSRPLVGTVRDAKSGKPVAGVTVSEVNNHIPKSVTDANGKYRIEGVPKKPWYGFNVAGTKGLPYFDHTHLSVTDTGGLDELETNLTIDRGLELTGRVVDKAGRPVRAEVFYSPLDNNPNAKPNLMRAISSDGWKTKPDGTFYLTVWPGQGVIDVRAKEGDRYATVDAEKILSKLGVKSRPVGGVNAILPIDADEAKLESLSITVTLEDGTARKGSVVDPDGKPLAGATAAGLKMDGPPSAMASADFTLSGMNAESRRLLIFVHDEKKLGVVQPVSGAETDPVQVKLQPLGNITGEVRTEDGKPWTNLRVTALPGLADAKNYENLPTETLSLQGGLGLTRAPWWGLTRKTATTDKDGRFRLDGLLPGLEYTVYVSDGDLGERDTLVTSRTKVTITAGQTLDLGLLKKQANR